MEKYTKAVSATLAGALAVGMVPAMALADEAAPEVVADDGVELLVAGDAEDFAAGEITEVEDVEGKKIDMDELSFTLGAATVKPVPSVVTTLNGEKVDVTAVDDDGSALYEVEYWLVGKKNESGFAADKAWAPGIWLKAVDSVDVAGTYYVTVVAKDHAADEDADAPALKFTVAAASLADAYLYEVNGGALEPKSDTTFVYTGEEIELALTFGPNVVDDVESSDHDAIQFFYQDPETKKYAEATGDVLEAGNYIAWVKATSGDYKGFDKQIQFKVEALDLTDAEITFGTTKEYAPIAETPSETIGGVLDTLVSAVGDVTYETIKDEIAVAHTGLIDSTPLALGVNKFTIAPAVDADGNASVNVKGAQTIEVVRYLESAVFFYGIEAVENDGEINILDSKTDEPTVIDPSKIIVIDADEAAVPYTVVYEKDMDPTTGEKWEEVSQYNEPGNYRAVVTVDDATYAIGGKAIYNFYVKGNVVDGDEQIFVSHWGEFVDSAENDYYDAIAYDGTDAVEDLEFAVYDEAGKKLTQGTDYELKITAGGKEVEAAIDAGKYVIEVVAADGTNYNISDNKFYLEVVQASVDPAIAGTKIIEGVEVFPYTGETVVPTIEYFAENNPATILDDAVVTLPTDAYEIVKIEYYNAKTQKMEEADGLLDEGSYEVTIKLTEAGAKNYNLLDTVIDVVVEDNTMFRDVAASAWYAESVEAANNLGIMTGYNRTDLFGPNDDLLRGHAALVLYRIADGGFTTGGFMENWFGEDVVQNFINFATPFADVKGNEVYAEAIGWCNKAGIMTGYADTDLFGDENPLTREELALTLCRFAATARVDTTADAAVLADYADASKVSSWAKAAVAWCVQEGLMGVNTDYLKPGENITRAEMAAMMVRFMDYMEIDGAVDDGSTLLPSVG